MVSVYFDSFFYYSFAHLMLISNNTMQCLFYYNMNKYGAYGMVMDLGKLFVNFDACSVFDATDVRVCFRCSSFNHVQSNCSLKITCPKCTGEHPLNKCTSSTLKCINCNNANLTDTSHAVWDAAKCPIYKKKLNNLKSSIFVTK